MLGPERLTSAWRGFGGGGSGGGGGGVGLSGAAYLAAPEAAELRGVDCVTGHGYVDHVGACEDCSGECGCEAEDLAAPFEDTLFKDFKLFS